MLQYVQFAHSILEFVYVWFYESPDSYFFIILAGAESLTAKVVLKINKPANINNFLKWLSDKETF